jgi:hypothetical protein
VAVRSSLCGIRERTGGFEVVDAHAGGALGHHGG